MDAPQGHDQNADQVAYWNGPAGQRWAARQAAQDVVLKPIADLVIDRAKLKPGERVIDVGCGTGATAIAFAQEVAPPGHVLGVDISGPMLERARQSAPKDLPVDFVLADATVYPFEPASFDVLASRFGVMFFADPALSFANMRKALRPSGRLAFACWREPRENPFFMAPLQAAYKHVPKLPQQGPEDPGPFSFADEARVTRIRRWLKNETLNVWHRERPAISDDAVFSVLTIVLKGDSRLQSVATRWNVEWYALRKCTRRPVHLWRFRRCGRGLRRLVVRGGGRRREVQIARVVDRADGVHRASHR
jgi:ubiquinone/menaquinone biosynthesis C-methylase UbiE